nr:BBP7 family outer membrane beta-barrel protein [Planctomycetales bacterium]NIP69227.1 BBP7 family outer membrane beta-barrel protein [Planctomycetales bacterium]
KHYLLASLIPLGCSHSVAAAEIQVTLLEQIEPPVGGEPGVGEQPEDAPADDPDASPFAEDFAADPERLPVAEEGDASPFGDDPVPAPEAFSAEGISPDVCGDCDACGDGQVAQDGACCPCGDDSPCRAIWDEPPCCGAHPDRMEEVTTIDGGASSFRSGDMLAQLTNIRRESRDAFAVLPEASAELGYLLTDDVRLTAGYTILWLSHAVRPGDQIDPRVDARFLNSNLVPPLTPPATRPAPRFIESSLWAQGIHFGLEWRY